jgi:UDP-glucose 4-epimerase
LSDAGRNPARYLVTGGAGFIGSHLVEALLRRGQRVRVLDDFSTGKRDNLSFLDRFPEEVAANCELRAGDVRNLDAVRECAAGVDYILHHAALGSVQRSVEDPIAANEVNVGGTLNVLKAALDSQTKGVVYASSSSIYGAAPTLPRDEDQFPAPLSPYAASKLAGELYCSVFAKTYGLSIMGLRYFNVFGPRQDPQSQYSAVIPRFIDAALCDRCLEIHGDGLQTRDFTYVENVVDANLRAVKALAVADSGAVFNIACGETYSVLDLVGCLSQLLGKNLRMVHREPRKGDVRDSVATITKAEQQLGYRPKTTFMEGLSKTVAYYREHQSAMTTGVSGKA